MFKKLALASLTVLVFRASFGQVSISTDGGTTGGAVTSSPISNSVSTTGASTSQGGAGGSVGAISTGASSSTGGSNSMTTGTTSNVTGASTSTAGASTSSGNTSGNTTITSNYIAPKIPVATAVAPSNFPTAPCMGSSSIGGSAVLFGFSAGSSWEATECMTFEAARSFDQAGMHDDALAIKCTSKYSAAAPSCIKLKQQEQQAQIPVVQQLQFDQPKPEYVNLIKGIYSETIDPITGFITIIDTRETRGRIAIAR